MVYVKTYSVYEQRMHCVNLWYKPGYSVCEQGMHCVNLGYKPGYSVCVCVNSQIIVLIRG